MNDLESLFEKTRHLPEGEKERLIAQFMETKDYDKFLIELNQFGERTKEDMDNLHQQVDDAWNKKLNWLNQSWINTSEVCLMLYGSKAKSKTSLFAQKRTGKRRWKAEELEKLENIRKDLIISLSQD